MDVVSIKNLEIFSNHGVLKEENILGQKFLISVEISLSTRNAGNTDNIELSVNYADVCHTIKNIMEKNTFKLIETAAEKISETVLLKFSNAVKIKTEIKKPWAPIMLPLEHVSVSVERSWHTVYLSLGSNIGDTNKFLTDGISLINENRLCSVTKKSDFIITKPVGYTDQDDFLNCCIEIKTLMTPHELLSFINSVEAKQKRERKIHWGPRTLDIDIILYDNEIICDDILTIPHSEMANREFVLKPLCQIAPYALNPVLNMAVCELYKFLPSLYEEI